MLSFVGDHFFYLIGGAFTAFTLVMGYVTVSDVLD